MSTNDQPLDQEPQDQDDFDSAFSEFSGSEEPAEHAPATDEGEQEAAQESQASRQGDEPQDELTPRERELQSQLDRLAHSEASQRGRLSAYQRQINELQQQVQRPAAQEGKAPEASQEKQDMAAEMGSDDWESFKEDFPDMARAFESRLSADRAKQAQLEQQVQELRTAVQPIEQKAQEQHLQDQYDALNARHADWQEVVAAPEFAQWLNQLPPGLQSLQESNDAAEAAALLDMYKAQHPTQDVESRPTPHDKRQDRLAQAQTVSRRGAARREGTPDDFEAAFHHYASKDAR